MKILCLIDGLGFGGAQRQIIGLAFFLKNKGYNVDLACYHQRSFYNDLLGNLGISPITINCGKRRVSKLFGIYSFINNSQYDIVISYLGGPNIITCLIKLFLKSDFKLIVSDRNTTQQVTWTEKVRYWLYRQADYIVPNSYSQEKYILKNFPSLKCRISTITNFTDTHFFAPSNYQNKSKDTLKILVAGRIDEQKNIPRFIDAMSILKSKGVSFHVKWYGNVRLGAEDYYNEIIRKRDYSHLSEEIDFFKGTSDIRTEYQTCDLFCLPSLYEGFPNVVCEAMSCGKPIVASNVCDNPLIIKDGENGFLFDPYQPERLVDCIMSFIRMSQSQKDEMGKKNREIAVEMFSEDVFVNKYISLIEK